MSKKTAIVVGTGAGGAEMANDLQGDFQVTVLEAGWEFRPFTQSINRWAGLRKTGLFFDERLIRLLIPNMMIKKTEDMVLVKGKGLGGTTTLATGNAVRYDRDIRKLGINLDREFEELSEILPITTDHRKDWTDTTKRMYQVFEDMDLSPVVTPKLLDAKRCVGCGRCAVGCPNGAKWDTRALVESAKEKGAEVITGCRVEKLEIESGRVREVIAVKNGKKLSFSADVIVLAAGGLDTPVILENSGIETDSTLFVDPVLCVAGPMEGIRQDRQILMPFISQQNGYILAPYMDYLSFFFDRRWRLPITDIASIMIKLADEERGSSSPGGIVKTMSEKDHEKMAEAVELSRKILENIGIERKDQFLGILNAGHPGGMLPLTEDEKDSLHSPLLAENLYVADATIIPKAMGNPPILTIMALSRKIAGVIRDKFAV